MEKGTPFSSLLKDLYMHRNAELASDLAKGDA